MEETKRFSIGANVLALLLEQVSLQPKVTADFISTMVKNDIQEIIPQKEEKKDDDK